MGIKTITLIFIIHYLIFKVHSFGALDFNDLGANAEVGMEENEFVCPSGFACSESGEMETPINDHNLLETPHDNELPIMKRKNEFIRFGKRKNEFIRFGKRGMRPEDAFRQSVGKRAMRPEDAFRQSYGKFGYFPFSVKYKHHQKRKNEFIRFG
uniref:Uncharacterized protein n=1 Tax=Rhabditophanes sp. KR3021 TaxID=114890 RepID=A0AC35U7T0_9BILA